MKSELVKNSLSDRKSNHNSTIMPRFAYSIDLLDMIIIQLEKKRNLIRNSNHYYFNSESILPDDYKKLESEASLIFSLETLKEIQKKLHSVSGIHNITVFLPSTISVIRIISSKLFEMLPEFSQSLSELSSVLGGIIVDSATITEAKFDFKESNLESNRILTEAKLIVGSKLRTQYPNVDFEKSMLA